MTALVNLRKDKDREFLKAKNHKNLWNEIAREMQEQKINVDGPQCNNKWKALKKEYKKAIDNNNQKCAFFEEFNEMYGLKAGVRPEALINSNSSNDVPAKTTPPRPVKEKKKRKAAVNPTLEWLKEHESKREKREEERVERQERHHQERQDPEGE